MSFNFDISKQAQQFIFSRKAVTAFYIAVFLNSMTVACCSTHKYLGMYLDEKLNFGRNINEKITKANKDIYHYQKIT